MYRGSSTIPKIWVVHSVHLRDANDANIMRMPRIANYYLQFVDSYIICRLASWKRAERAAVGEHSYSIEVPAVRRDGGIRRENVGMSNHYPNEKLEPRKSKVSVALAINHGLGGPKAMAKAAADGKLVNIPALPNFFEAATREIR